MTEQNDIAVYAGIARDIAFVVVCLVVAFVALALLATVRKVAERVDEAMDKVDSLLESLASARDALKEFRAKVKERTASASSRSNQGFNVVTWLLSPLGYVINRQFRRRSRDKGE